jgi:imidazolonepropionase-like amidohydrolase
MYRLSHTPRPCLRLYVVPAAGCLAVLLLLAAFAAGPSMAQAPSPQTIAFTGGQWFDGETFVDRPLYVDDGRFTDTRPARIDTTIALDGHFVVPPFAEAHTHRVDQTGVLPSANDAYLADGVFYVANLNNLPSFARPMRDTLGLAHTVDVAFAHGGFTSPGAHPQPLYENLIDRGVYDGWTKEQLAGEAYHAVTTSAELDAAFARIQQDAPDLIKAYLMFSGTDRAAGLTPELLGELVGKAHAAGKRVAVHAQTARDVRVAAEQGADQIAHMPPMPFGDTTTTNLYRITPEIAQLLAANDVSVVTTTVLVDRYLSDHPARPVVRQLQRDNLRTLHEAGVRLAVGSDTWSSGQNEAMYLHDLGVFNNRTLLQTWISSGSIIFPERNVGRLAPDYEASLLALRCNPVEDFACVDDIAVRVKEGVVLPSSSEAPSPSAR